MFKAGLNSLALRFGGFGHRGDGFGFVFLLVILGGMVIWVVSRPNGAESPKS